MTYPRLSHSGPDSHRPDGASRAGSNDQLTLLGRTPSRCREMAVDHAGLSSRDPMAHRADPAELLDPGSPG